MAVAWSYLCLHLHINSPCWFVVVGSLLCLHHHLIVFTDKYTHHLWVDGGWEWSSSSLSSFWIVFTDKYMHHLWGGGIDRLLYLRVLLNYVHKQIHTLPLGVVWVRRSTPICLHLLLNGAYKYTHQHWGVSGSLLVSISIASTDTYMFMNN